MKSKIAILVALWLCTTSAISGPEAGQRKYALLSLIGDSLTVVTHRPVTGTSIDQNVSETINLPDAAFDKAALRAMDNALRKADSEASVILLAPSSAGPRTQQDPLFDGQRFASFEGLDEALKKTGATHLLLVTKYRAESKFPTTLGKIGSGMLEGLGFYIDRTAPLRRSDTGERGVGFLGPYAYFKISFIDLATSTVLKQQAITAATTISAARSKDSFDPWDALSSTEKVTRLRGMITREVINAVPALVESQ